MSASRPRRQSEDCRGGGYAFVGFGELGRQLARLFLTPRERAGLIAFDDALLAAGAPEARAFGEWADAQFADRRFVVALGYQHPAVKEKILHGLLARSRRVPALVHPRAWVDPTAHVGPGVVVYPLGNVDGHSRLETGALLHSSTVVSHDATVGTCAYLSPGVVLCGGVLVGARAFVGAGSVVANGLEIGADARVGLGTVVTAAVAPDASVIGSPMRVLDRPLTLR